MVFSERISNMQASPIRKLLPLASETKKKGIKVYHLNIGQPDIETPKEYVEAIVDHKDKVLSYADSKGLPVLLDAFAQYYSERKMNFTTEDLIITNGGSEAILFAYIALCDAGDEILIPEPYYTNYNSIAQMLDIKVIPITTKAEEGFALPKKSEVLKLITPKTKAIVLNNPSNPTGKVLTKEETEIIRDVVLETGIFAISDEVYKEFVYDGCEFISFSSFKEIENNVILVDSISKRYSACGARVGCIASKNKELMANILKLAQGRLSVATLEQIGAANLVNVPDSYMETVAEEYRNRRNVVFNALQEIDGVVCKLPYGAFYIMAKLPVENAEDFVKWLIGDFNIDNETVLLTPGENFYGTPGIGRDEVRISYCLNCDDLKKAMNIVKEGLKVYNERVN